jgi:hypothetical protein
MSPLSGPFRQLWRVIVLYTRSRPVNGSVRQGLASSGWASRKRLRSMTPARKPTPPCLCNRTVQLRRCVLLLLLTFAVPGLVLGQTPEDSQYRDAMSRAVAALKRSFERSADAALNTEQAKAIDTEACKSRDTSQEVESNRLKVIQQSLDQDSEAFARTALTEYRLAQALQPQLVEPIYGEALALLQLKEYCDAIQKLEFVRLGFNDPEIKFYLGSGLVSSVGLGSPHLQAGINLLQEYIHESTGRGVPEKDPNLRTAKDLLNAANSKSDGARKQIDLKDREPNSVACPTPFPARTELPFVASISAAVGYNDNVLKLADGVALPSGINQRDSPYNEFSLTVGRDFPLRHPCSAPACSTGWLSDKLSLQYILVEDAFDELPNKDRILQTAFVSYQRSFTTEVGGLLKLNDDWLYKSQRVSGNLCTSQVALVLNETGRGKTLLSYYLIRTDGFTAQKGLGNNNPDGFSNRVELAQTWVAIRDPSDFSTVLTLSSQYAHEWDQPTGIAPRFQRNELLGKAEWRIFHARDQCAFVRALTARVSDTWQSDDYDDITSAPKSGLSPRSDQTNLLVLGVNVPMWYDRYMANAGVADGNRIEAVIEYRHTTRDSNYYLSNGYDQNIFLATMKVNF